MVVEEDVEVAYVTNISGLILILQESKVSLQVEYMPIFVSHNG